jgi:hypothetical protein
MIEDRIALGVAVALAVVVVVGVIWVIGWAVVEQFRSLALLRLLGKYPDRAEEIIRSFHEHGRWPEPDRDDR